MMKKISLLLLALAININLFADEGMWLLMYLKKMNEKEMQSKGLKLTADDIYNVNNSSLKDAIVSLGGFCTGEIISNEGLMLTNHHCAYGSIQFHSSVKNDYLTDGFWAKTKAEELPNEGLTASILDYMENVTDKVLEGIKEGIPAAERTQLVTKNIQALDKEYAEKLKTEGKRADIKEFFEGSEYYMLVYTVYKDIRLVGAPPSAIGKFGGDTDNWMWPRHTGDFSLYRIYADKDGKPAEFSSENVPLQPKHFLPISLEGVDEKSYTMIMGFPGSTDRYLSSYGIKMALEIDQPSRIKIRGKKLELMKEDMNASDEVRIQYSSKYARVSNYYKYFQGQSRGLKRLKVYDKKVALENTFSKWVAESGQQELYGNVLERMENSYNELSKYKKAQVYFTEAALGSEVVLFAVRHNQLITLYKSGAPKEQIDAAIENLKKAASGFFKDYNAPTDKKITAAMLEMYAADVEKSQQPDIFNVISKKHKNNFKAYTEGVFAKSIFVNEDKLNKFYEKPSLKVLENDPAMQLALSFYNNYMANVAPVFNNAAGELADAKRLFVQAIRIINKDKNYYPDANSSIRLTYGEVGSYQPADATTFDFITTIDGIFEKEDPTNDEFIIPERLKRLYEKKDYGQYADKNGNLIVNFISNNDITGGNSGSPVINAKGHLIGCAFDGNWEAMSGDIAFEPELQRTISVDIRYILFIIDKYAGADNLIKEMKLVK
jgi:hypothetical protein